MLFAYIYICNFFNVILKFSSVNYSKVKHCMPLFLRKEECLMFDLLG